MPRDPKKYLYDIQQAARHAIDFTNGKTFQEYEKDVLLRSGVERQLEIIGEALNQLSQVAPETAVRIPEHRRIINFRNALIHGYGTLDSRIVWGVIESKLPSLVDVVGTLLEEDG